jgi:hypothetical protein
MGRGARRPRRRAGGLDVLGRGVAGLCDPHDIMTQLCDFFSRGAPGLATIRGRRGVFRIDNHGRSPAVAAPRRSGTNVPWAAYLPPIGEVDLLGRDPVAVVLVEPRENGGDAPERRESPGVVREPFATRRSGPARPAFLWACSCRSAPVPSAS